MDRRRARRLKRNRPIMKSVADFLDNDSDPDASRPWVLWGIMWKDKEFLSHTWRNESGAWHYGDVGRSMCWMALTRKMNQLFCKIPCFGSSQQDKKKSQIIYTERSWQVRFQHAQSVRITASFFNSIQFYQVRQGIILPLCLAFLRFTEMIDECMVTPLWIEIWKGGKQMKHSFKRVLAIMLSVLLIMSNLGLTAFAGGFTSDPEDIVFSCSLQV